MESICSNRQQFVWTPTRKKPSVWTNLECVSFCVGCILLTKSLLCNVAIFIRDAALSRVYSSAKSFKKILWSLEASLFWFPATVRTTCLFRPDTHQCLEAHQSSRRSQCSSASVRMTWLYHSDAIQGLTNIRVSTSRHSYGKTATTVWTMCDSVRTMFSIRQDVHQFNRLDISL